MTQSETEHEPEREPVLAPLGHPAEAEVPRHDHDPVDGDELETSAAYELAVEDGRPLPPDVLTEGRADDGAPLFREPGA